MKGRKEEAQQQLTSDDWSALRESCEDAASDSHSRGEERLLEGDRRRLARPCLHALLFPSITHEVFDYVLRAVSVLRLFAKVARHASAQSATAAFPVCVRTRLFSTKKISRRRTRRSTDSACWEAKTGNCLTSNRRIHSTDKARYGLEHVSLAVELDLEGSSLPPEPLCTYTPEASSAACRPAPRRRPPPSSGSGASL